MHKMLTRLHCFFVPDFRDRLSALAELQRDEGSHEHRTHQTSQFR